MGADLCPAGTLIDDAPKPLVELNKRLIVEELQETYEAVRADNLTEIADGCADSLYVIAHAINQLGRCENIKRREAAQVALADAVERTKLSLDREWAGKFFKDGDVDRNLAFAEIVVRGVASMYGIPLEAVFDEVHRSNMTKRWPDGTVRRDAGGKVMKPPQYEKPQVALVLQKHGVVE